MTKLEKARTLSSTESDHRGGGKKQLTTIVKDVLSSKGFPPERGRCTACRQVYKRGAYEK